MKNGFGLKGVRESLSEGNESVLKTCHICLIKLKTRIFSGLGSSVTVAIQSRECPLKFKSFREKLLVANKSRDSGDSLCMNLKNFQLLPKKFRRKSLVAKYS